MDIIQRLIQLNILKDICRQGVVITNKNQRPKLLFQFCALQLQLTNTNNKIVMHQKEDNNNATIRYSQQNYEQSVHRHNRYFSQVPPNSKQTQRITSARINSVNQGLHTRKLSVNSVSKNSEVDQLEKQYQRLIKRSKGLLQANKNLTKHQIIRITRWLAKLQIRPSNIIWKKNINFYLKVLIEMIIQNKIMEPFINVPKDGQLPKLTLYDVPFPIREHLQTIMGQNHEQYDKKSNYSKGKTSKGYVFQKDLKKSEFQAIIGNQSFTFEKQLISMDGTMQNSYYQPQSEINYAPQDIDFSEDNAKMNMVIVPCFTHHKSKKKHQKPKESSKTAKVTESKPVIKGEPQIKGATTESLCCLDQNKQNNPLPVNSSNITRKLFKSKDKINLCSIKQKGNAKTFQNNQTVTLTNENQLLSQERCFSLSKQKQINKKGFQILMKVADFIGRNESNFIEGNTSANLINKIKQIGSKLNINISSQDPIEQNLDTSIMSEKSRAFIKASEQIRNKFSETDQQTVQFLSFLKNLKNRVQI